MIRHLIPRIDAGRWGGGALTDDWSPQGDEVIGYQIAIQWLGLMFEISLGCVGRRVR